MASYSSCVVLLRASTGSTCTRPLSGWHVQRAVEDFHHRGDPAAGGGVGFLGRGELVDEGVGDDLQAAQAVVEDQQACPPA